MRKLFFILLLFFIINSRVDQCNITNINIDTSISIDKLYECAKNHNLKHIDIIVAQAILETGNFTSKHCVENNNLFGLYDSKNKRYYKFNHWSESVIAYKNKIQYKYKDEEDYYDFLIRIKYAEDKEYINKLKSIK